DLFFQRGTVIDKGRILVGGDQRVANQGIEFVPWQPGKAHAIQVGDKGVGELFRRGDAAGFLQLGQYLGNDVVIVLELVANVRVRQLNDRLAECGEAAVVHLRNIAHQFDGGARQAAAGHADAWAGTGKAFVVT